MKRLLLLLVFINVMQSVVAALPDKELVLNASDGTSTCAVKGIRRITFDNGVMFRCRAVQTSLCKSENKKILLREYQKIFNF